MTKYMPVYGQIRASQGAAYLESFRLSCGGPEFRRLAASGRTGHIALLRFLKFWSRQTHGVLCRVQGVSRSLRLFDQ